MTSYNITRRQHETSSHFAAVEVEPVRVLDRNGDEVLVTRFWLNGHNWPSTEGRRIKKNGEPENRTRTSLYVPVPQDILEILYTLEAQD